MNLPHRFESVPLTYSDDQPTNQNSWNSQLNPILIFETEKSKTTDIDNIKLSLHQITNFIKKHPFKNNRKEDILCLKGFGQAAYSLISAMFESSWNALKIRESNKTFQLKIIENLNSSI